MEERDHLGGSTSVPRARGRGTRADECPLGFCRGVRGPSRAAGKGFGLGDLQYLRGNVVRCPAEGGGSGVSKHVLLTHAEVCNFDVPVRVQHHVVQLQIPADDDKTRWREAEAQPPLNGPLILFPVALDKC